MRKRILAALMITTLCFAGCQNSTQADMPVATPTVTTAPTEAPEPTEVIMPTEETTPTETIVPTIAPTEAPVTTEALEVTEVPEITGESVITEVPVEEPTKEPISTEKPMLTPEPTAPVAPTATPKPTPMPTATPKPTGNVSKVEGVLYLENLGVSIPTLSKFNTVGLEDTGGVHWINVNGEDATAQLQTAADSIIKALKKRNLPYRYWHPNFIIEGDNIRFLYEHSNTPDLNLIKNTYANEYILSINRPLKEDVYEGTDLSPYSCDILKLMLSIISSTPDELFQAIYDTIYVDYVIPENEWGEVGDCMAYADLGSSQGKHLVFKFKEKSNSTAGESKPAKEPSGYVQEIVVWNGEPMKLSSMDVSIPTLTKFNSEALKEGNYWAGEYGNGAMTTIYDTFNNVRWTHGSKEDGGRKGNQLFYIDDTCIAVSWLTTRGNPACLELYRNTREGHYTLIINKYFEKHVDIGGGDKSEESKDALKVLISLFSSTPELVYSTLYDDLYGTKHIDTETYTSVGDCLIKYDNTKSSNNQFVYLIKEGIISEPKPTKTPNPSSGNGNWNGEKVVLKGIDYATTKRSTFNTEALKNSKNSAWWGDVNDTPSGQALIDVLSSVANILEYRDVAGRDHQLFLIQDYTITFDWLMKGGNSDFELRRDPTSGEYTLEINTRLDSDTTSWGEEVGKYNRDIMMVMLSMISSTPEEVFDKIYEDLYGEVCISENGWTTIGDCKVQYDDPESYKGHYVYHIKAK